MKKIIKNYKQSIILIGSLIIGTIVGLIFKEKATVLEPLGTLFINMLLVVVVPLIFYLLQHLLVRLISLRELVRY